MATTISIQSGNLTTTRTVQDDAKAQAILTRCADAIGATGNAQAKLDAVLAFCIQQIQAHARDRDYQTRYATTMANLESDNTWG